MSRIVTNGDSVNPSVTVDGEPAEVLWDEGGAYIMADGVKFYVVEVA